MGYTPDVLTEACAELAVGLVLCTTRRLIEANRHVHSGEWKGWYITYMCGRGIADSTVGIVGMGRIGKTRLYLILSKETRRSKKIIFRLFHCREIEVVPSQGNYLP